VKAKGDYLTGEEWKKKTNKLLPSDTKKRKTNEISLLNFHRLDEFKSNFLRQKSLEIPCLRSIGLYGQQ